MLYAFYDDFQFSLFDFPHLSSFNACEELDHLLILCPLAPALMSIEGDIVPPPNYYGGAALAFNSVLAKIREGSPEEEGLICERDRVLSLEHWSGVKGRVSDRW